MSNKLFSLVLIILLALSAGSAWASGETEKSSEITFLTPETDPTSVDTDNSIIQAFEEANPGVTVNLSHADLEQVLPKLSAMLRAGTAPDVAFLSPRYLSGLIEQDFVVEMTDVYDALADVPGKLVTPSMDGKIYDIPIATESKVLYYRTDIFEQAGLSVPSTTEEWIDIAEKLTVDTDGDGNIDQWGIGIELTPSNVAGVYLQYLWAFGGDAFDENNNVTIDSPVAIEALQFLLDMTKFCPPGVANTGYSDLGIMFAQGVVAMACYPGRILSIIDRYSEDLNGKVDVSPFPMGPYTNEPIVKATINDFVVFKTSNNTELAKKFVEFYMSDDQYYKFLTASVPGHSLPVRESWLDNQAYFEHPAITKWSDIVQKSMGWAYEYGTDYQFRNDGAVNPYFGRAISAPVVTNELHKVITGQQTPEEALTTIANEWREMFGIQ